MLTNIQKAANKFKKYLGFEKEKQEDYSEKFKSFLKDYNYSFYYIPDLFSLKLVLQNLMEDGFPIPDDLIEEDEFNSLKKTVINNKGSILEEKVFFISTNLMREIYLKIRPFLDKCVDNDSMINIFFRESFFNEFPNYSFFETFLDALKPMPLSIKLPLCSEEAFLRLKSSSNLAISCSSQSEAGIKEGETSTIPKINIKVPIEDVSFAALEKSKMRLMEDKFENSYNIFKGKLSAEAVNTNIPRVMEILNCCEFYLNEEHLHPYFRLQKVQTFLFLLNPHRLYDQAIECSYLLQKTEMEIGISEENYPTIRPI